MASWGYGDSQCPPENWGKLYPISDEGHRQSPINIDTSKAKKVSYPALQLHYKNDEVSSVVNNGHSVTFALQGGSSHISGSSLAGSYKLLQFHFHWGSTDNAGSEHTLNGKQYSAELHLVHQNEKYDTFNEAIQHADGLCVIGVFLEVEGNSDHKFLQRVIEHVKKVPNKDDKCAVDIEIDLEGLLPGERSYAHYSGSLTTPSLNECVTWIAMLQPIKISRQQIETFRGVNSCHGGHLVNNYRPVQELHDRSVEIVE